ncbi:hypothetical protein BDA96_01G152300 [Sorghum bicolor]|jgi:hypothetical protein|uniref:Uncharacterized protein n=2 Tax=Sorghum bicolor TaxID=4558 RepID=A0A921RYW9_SORBI|nr:hypothetical protein BDA96_01G152300 [Sorghum bicolor]KXG37886.1 hypothetical protein SORBI_3001G145300 [Sorghum bicolor]
MRTSSLAHEHGGRQGGDQRWGASTRAMQGPGQQLSGWRGRGFEDGLARWGGQLQTVQGRTDGHAAPRPSARSRCSRRRAGLGSREAERRGRVGEWESSGGSEGGGSKQQRELRNMKGIKAKALGPLSFPFYGSTPTIAFAL